jgi:hypothetical protein
MERLRDVFDLVFLPGAVYNARTRPRPKATYGAFFFRSHASIRKVAGHGRAIGFSTSRSPAGHARGASLLGDMSDVCRSPTPMSSATLGLLFCGMS